MDDQSKTDKVDLLELTTRIVASHLANNSISVSEVAPLIEEVYATLSGMDANSQRNQKPVPAVPIEESVTNEYLVCLEEGKKLKMLKRHLKSRYNMTPEEYHARWGLPVDYPMVAPNYAKRRQQLAKEIGLGKKR